MKELKDTIELMTSASYKDRMKAEYWQTRIRYEKLNRFLTKIEAVKAFNNGKWYPTETRDEPEHDCPYDLLNEQKHVMRKYLHILEVRAEIEGIDLYKE